MPIDEAGLAAAMDAGIAQASSAAPTPAATPAPTTTETPDETQALAGSDAGGDEAGGDEGGSGGEPPAAGGNDEAAGGADDGGEAPAPGGEGEAAPAGGKPADGTAGAPAKPEELTHEQKIEKALIDPTPNAWKKETKERFQILAGTVKERTERLKRTQNDLNTMIDAVTSTGATPAQYQQALGYLRLVNSDRLEDKEQLLDFLQKELRAVATIVGRPVAGVNFLEGHEDLIREVGEGRLSQARAMEIAAGRERDKRARTIGEQSRSREEAQFAHQQAATQARNDLNALGVRLQASDPQYAAKMQFLGPSLKQVIGQLPPAQWVPAFQRAYAEFKLPAAAARPAAPAATPAASEPRNTPLRPNNPAGGQQPEPKSSFEALNNALAQLGR